MLVEDPEDDMDGVSLRGTVIINPAGKVVHVSNTDAPVGRSVDEVLRLIQAFQYHEKHGEVWCVVTSLVFFFFHPSFFNYVPPPLSPLQTALRAGPRGQRQ